MYNMFTEKRKRSLRRDTVDDDLICSIKEPHYSNSLIGSLSLDPTNEVTRIRTLSTQSSYIPPPSSVISQLERMGFLRNRRHSLKDVLFSPKVAFAFRNECDYASGIRGLINLGNTCYMNAAIQALSNCPAIRDYFCLSDIDDEFSNLGNSQNNDVSMAFRKLIQRIWTEDSHAPIKPTYFLFQVRRKCAQFRGFGQQDAQEFIRCFLDVLHQELKYPIDMDSKPLLSPSSLSTSSSAVDDSGDSGMSTENESAPKEDSSKTYHKEVQNENEANTSSAGDSTLQSNRENEEKTKEDSEKDKPVKVNYESLVNVVFDGKLVSTVRCLTCHNLSYTTENYQDLSLSIPSVDQLEKMKNAFEEADSGYADSSEISNNSGYLNWFYGFTNTWLIQPWFSWISNFYRYMFSGSVLLDDCLCAFFAADYLRGDDMYRCDKCEKLRNGVKQCRLKSLPEVLCIHLKRFRHDTAYNAKINTRIKFQLRDLDLQPYMEVDEDGNTEKNEGQSYMYDLISLVSHRGGSVDFGHYVAYCMNQLNGNWYEFDDSFVRQVSEEDVEAAEAYVLFYQRRSLFDEIDDF